MKTPRLSRLTLALAAAGVGTLALAQGAPTDVGTVRITGSGDTVANGYVLEDEGTKQRSALSRDAIAKERPSANPFQLLNLLPGVNATSYDATGLFGGNLRVRSFNSDQMGFTINGAPVNDSGNFAVYPQEYTDTENLCELFVTQGSTDTDSPHVGSSGGNVGLVTCGPNDKRGGRIVQSVGQLNFYKTFLRYDTGLFGAQHPTKLFFSVSKSEADKFKGLGKADREHVDIGLQSRLSSDTLLTASLLYNRAINNNYLTLTKREFETNPGLDFTSTVPQHLASGDESTTSGFGTSSVGVTPRAKTAYYGYALNPFENALFTARIQTRINDKLTLSAEPYFWYGYGTGGVQQTTLAESASNAAALRYGVGNINGNTSNSDRVGVYRGSVTETYRPGVTFKASYTVDNHRVLAGLWYEAVDHRQTQPATRVGNDGSIGDLWLRSNLITYNDGSTYQGRNWKTRSTAYSAFVSDTITMGRLELTPGLRYTSIERDFTNYASSGSGGGADYNVNKTFDKPLASFGARFKVDDEFQAFANVTQNMRTPSNFIFSGWVSSVTYANGVAATSTLRPDNKVRPETSVTTEAGLRYGGTILQASATLFRTSFKDRLAQSYNPETGTYTDWNVGDSTVNGLELQLGTKPVNGWSVFGSYTLTDSKISNDMRVSASSTVASAGKAFPDTPRTMYGLSVQYAQGPFMAALAGKYTGKRYTTLANDEWLDAYTTLDLNVGYRFASTDFFKNPTVRLNVSNLTNTKYLAANSGSGSNITTSVSLPGSQGGGFPTYYVGAPRFASVSLSAEF